MHIKITIYVQTIVAQPSSIVDAGLKSTHQRFNK